MFISGKRLKAAFLGSALIGVFAFTGCATIGSDGSSRAAKEKPAKVEAAKKAPVEKKAAKKSSLSIESIRSSSDGSRVIVNTSNGRVKYTVFKLNNPSRLVVDMPDVDMSKVGGAVNIQNDLVKGVEVQPMAEGLNIGRIVIGLADEVDYSVVANENLLMVSLTKIPPVQEVGAADAKESAVDTEEVAVPVAGAVKPIEPVAVKPVAAAEQKDAKPASGITGISAASVSGNTVVTIALNGAVGEFKAFVLDKPTRLVIDVPGLKNLTGKGAFKVKKKYITSVRVAEHKGKVRLVVDSPDKKLPDYVIVKEGSTLQLNMGAKPFPVAKTEAPASAALGAKAAEPVGAVVAEPAAEPVKAVEAAPAAEPAKTEQTAAPVETAKAEPVVDESALVTLVDFRKLNGNGRLTIVRSKKTGLSVVESPDGKTLMLDLKGATLMNELKRTLDASKLKTQVVAVSSYQESEAPVKDVRVLVKLVGKTKYDVMETDTAVSVDFAQPVTLTDAVDAQSKDVDVSVNIESNSGEDAINSDKKKVFTGKKIDIDMVDANLHDIFRLIAEVSNFNIIASDDIKGTITLRLKNVPWDQAFDIILKSKDLGISRIGNVIRVAPAAMLRKEKETAMASKKAQEKLEPLEIRFIAVNFATASELETHVKGVLTDRGSVSSEKRTNTLIVKDVKKGIADAESVIASLDNPIPQVQIEARIVEAESSFTRDLGIQWGVDANLNSDSNSTQVLGSSSQNGQMAGDVNTQNGVTSGDLNTSNTIKNNWPVQTGVTNYAVNLPAASTLGALGFIVGRSGSNPFILDLRLSAGEQAGRLKTISRPRVTTLDNKEAKIEQGEAIPFETSTSTGTAITFIDANLSLTVTPHITPDGSVLMQIKASRNSLGTFRSSSGVPSINKKEASTEVLVLDGETTVIGGIIVSETNNSESGIPYLKEIPLLGWFFKNKSVLDNQKELLIFITPTIIKEVEKGLSKEKAA
ncbi:MAG: hypothetical protein A3J24_10180 [Deltaproteobacteria bacterium RIFCSPLOWO2_02_FULL_53_8]|nr:MAG: hypothetical protein A3J24_10180 [Deltaproteobacteria bacterium RIFCSPLOWO2_02_FULL_53_8]